MKTCLTCRGSGKWSKFFEDPRGNFVTSRVVDCEDCQGHGFVLSLNRKAEQHKKPSDTPPNATRKVCEACKGTGRWSEGTAGPMCTMRFSTCLACGGSGYTSHVILGKAIRDIAKDEWIVVECKPDGTITSDAIAFAEGTRWDDVLNCNR